MFRSNKWRQSSFAALQRVSRRLQSRIAELEKENSELKERAVGSCTDPLTGLFDRRVLHDVLQQTLETAQNYQGMVAVLLLDLDRFKLINETLGHKTGDRLLVAVARRLIECIGQQDTLCRLGGDEFLVILPNTQNIDDASALARMIVDELAQPYCMDGFELFVTASVGISVFPSDGEDAEVLLKNAESAMYRAKDHGKNNFQLYNETINANLIWRLAMENRLRRAVENEEFFLVYQPQVDVKTAQIVGMEALVRWHNGEDSIVSPADFIPLAEETGLIVPLGEWVLRTACQQNKAWQQAGFPSLRISVNLSARQFQEADLLVTIRSVLQDTGLAASSLTIELTESIIMANPAQTIAILNELKAMGVQVSIDDFGTGYSSLAYLKRFPIDTLKIDKSFVNGVTEDAGDAAIVTAVAQMAHSLTLKVVAEGVELAEQLAFIQSCCCDVYQGYYYSKPLTTKSFTELLEKNFPIGT